jgi:hypothetical protein
MGITYASFQVYTNWMAMIHQMAWFVKNDEP